METLQAERRGTATPTARYPRPMDTERVVRQAILLQGVGGTAGAVEYLKANGVDSAVIARVLSRGAIRRADEDARDNPQAWD